MYSQPADHPVTLSVRAWVEETRWDLISCAAIYNTVPTLRFLEDIFKRMGFRRLMSTAGKKLSW